ncbi:MAG: hypothetical protein OSJ69_16735 [Acetatifactor sp.]|nr:hypothetical protein [Acetatifactor sp.]
MKEKQMAAAIGLVVIVGMTGCVGKEGAQENPQENVSAGAENEQEDQNGSVVPATQEGEWAREEPVSAQEKVNEKPEESGGEEPIEPEKEGQAVAILQETAHLGGKVQAPQADGMTLAQTTLVDEDGMVTLLDVEEAKKIPVRFTKDTKVEHWTIQGGGAGIDMREAALSDLEEGMSVELEGYYEAGTFVATRVIMEIYV